MVSSQDFSLLYPTLLLASSTDFGLIRKERCRGLLAETESTFDLFDVASLLHFWYKRITPHNGCLCSIIACSGQSVCDLCRGAHHMPASHAHSLHALLHRPLQFHQRIRTGSMHSNDKFHPMYCEGLEQAADGSLTYTGQASELI